MLLRYWLRVAEWKKKNLSGNLVQQKKKSSLFLDRISQVWSLWIVKLEIRSTNLPSKLRYNVNSYPCTTLLAKNKSAHTYRVSCKEIKKKNYMATVIDFTEYEIWSTNLPSKLRYIYCKQLSMMHHSTGQKLECTLL